MDSVVEKLMKGQQEVQESIETLLSGTHVPDFTNMTIAQYENLHAIIGRYCKGLEHYKTLRDLKSNWDKAFIECKAYCKEGLVIQIQSGNNLQFLNHPSWRIRIVKLCSEEPDETVRQYWLRIVFQAGIQWTKEEIQEFPVLFCVDCIKSFPVNRPRRENVSHQNKGMISDDITSDESEEEYPDIKYPSTNYHMGSVATMLLYIVRYHFTAIKQEDPQLVEQILKKWYRASIANCSKFAHILPGNQIQVVDPCDKELCTYIQDLYSKNLFSCVIQNRRQLLYRYGNGPGSEISTFFQPCQMMSIFNFSLDIEFPHLCYVFPTRIHIKHAKRDFKPVTTRTRFNIHTDCISMPIRPKLGGRRIKYNPANNINQVEQETTTIPMNGDICKRIQITAQNEDVFDIKIYGTVVILF